MKIVIFDLDGTLCDISHRLHFIKCDKPDWDAFHAACVDDEPKWDIIGLYDALMRAGHRMIIVSGRNSQVESETLQWLDSYGLPFSELIMRKEGDYTPDNELKHSWLMDGSLGAIDNILLTVDDRQRVVDMWREEGLTCLQVDAWEEGK